MSALQTKGFSAIVGTIAAGMQGRVSGRFLNFAFGSMLRAFAEAYAGILLWFQKLALDIAKLARLSTSYGSDADSFVADFPLITRFGAQPATGACTFSRFTPTAASAYVPVGGLVKTSDGLQSFQVIADPSNPAYVAGYIPAGSSVAIGGYVMGAQIASVVAPVQSITNGTTGLPGANGNVAANTITLTASSMPGVDNVINPNALTNGIDSESDDAFKARFRLNVLGRSGGTNYAIRAAVANIRSGMRSTIQEGVDPNGTFDPGMNTVFVDDGSGSIPPALLTAAQAAVGDNNTGARAGGIRWGVFPATIAPVTVAMQISTATGYDHNVALAQLATALSLAINAVQLGQTISYFALASVAQGVSGVVEVLPGYTLNGQTTDLVGSPSTVFRVAPNGLSLS